MPATNIFMRCIGAGIFIAVAGFGGFYLSETALEASVEAQSGPQGPRGPAHVQVVPVATEHFVDTVQAVGTTRARRAVELLPPASGQIEAILFEAGQQLREGEVLLRLRDVAERASLKAAEASLAEAQSAFDRQSQLARSGAAAQVNLETARASLMRAEAEVELARSALEDRVLRAPFDGVAGLSDLSVGAHIDAATVVTTLDNLSVIEVAFRVPERVLARLELGQVVELSSAAYPDRAFRATLRAIDTRVDQTTRSLDLRAEVPNGDAALRGGMFMQVSLVLDAREALSVPERALQMADGASYLNLARDGLVERAVVRTGVLRDGMIEITGGLEEYPDAQVIISNLQSIEAGDEIELAEPPRAAAGEVAP